MSAKRLIFLVGATSGVSIIVLVYWSTRIQPEHRFDTPSRGNLADIGRALLDYHEHNGRFPPPVVYGKGGRPLHSWRVAILPYLGYSKLFRELRKEEPWGDAFAALDNQNLLYPRCDAQLSMASIAEC